MWLMNVPRSLPVSIQNYGFIYTFRNIVFNYEISVISIFLSHFSQKEITCHFMCPCVLCLDVLYHAILYNIFFHIKKKKVKGKNGTCSNFHLSSLT